MHFFIGAYVGNTEKRLTENGQAKKLIEKIWLQKRIKQNKLKRMFDRKKTKANVWQYK